jgi:DNA-binding response OmpR family regulator
VSGEEYTESGDEGSPVVVFADDDPDIRELVAYGLKKSGYDVLLASDGEEALSLVRERSPALVILDGTMPRIDGFEATRRLRADPSTAQLPIMLLTARVQEGDAQLGLEAGADDYVRKPFSSDELRVRVEALLERLE